MIIDSSDGQASHDDIVRRICNLSEVFNRVGSTELRLRPATRDFEHRHRSRARKEAERRLATRREVCSQSRHISKASFDFITLSRAWCGQRRHYVAQASSLCLQQTSHSMFLKAFCDSSDSTFQSGQEFNAETPRRRGAKVRTEASNSPASLRLGVSALNSSS